MGKKKRESQLLPAAEVLQSLLQNVQSPLSDGFIRWKLWRFWQKVVGESIAEFSEPVSYNKGVLYVWVCSSAHLQECRFFAGTMLVKINRFVGHSWARRIQFTLDRKSVPRIEESPSKMREYLSDSSL